MADRSHDANQTDKAARGGDPSTEKPRIAKPEVRDENGAIEPTASRPRGKTEDPDKTL